MIRRFVKDAVIYSLPMFLAKAIGLILLPIYTRQLGPTDFGFIEFVAAVSAILLLVLPLEINQAVARLLPESDDQTRQRKILSSAFWFTFIVFGIFGSAIYLFRFQLLEVVSQPSSYAQYAALVCSSFLTTAILNLLQVQFRFTSQAKSSVSINMAVVLANLIFVLYFSAVARLGIEQYFLSQIVSGLIGITLGLAILVKKYGLLYWTIDVPIMRELLRFSLPIVLSSIGVAMSGSVDRLMVGGYTGLTDLGYYGAAARLAAMVGLGFYVISTAMTPIVYREHEQAETKKLIARVFKITTYSSLALLFVTVVYSEPIIVLIAGDKFSKASEYVFYLMFSAVITNLYIFFLGMDIVKNTRLLSKINLSAGVFGTIGCIILVPLIGIWGAITSILFANTARLAAYGYFSQRLYPVALAFRWPLVLTAALIVLNLLAGG
jgi:O-antigen/teichoic acid export membrane protein